MLSNILDLTTRWTALDYHPVQYQLFHSDARFIVVPSGRRSGKSELAKRRLVIWLWEARKAPKGYSEERYFAAGPTRDHAKRLWWNDLKALIPKWWIASISETDLSIKTIWGAELWVVGLDVTQRIEGQPWDGGVIDEYADCKPGIFDAHIRPALMDRKGKLWFIGVPDAKGPAQGEYKRMYNLAKSGKNPEWATFRWPSTDIVDATEIASSQSTMDERIYRQEVLGEFLAAGGRAFPDFENEPPFVVDVDYDPSLPLCWTLDFNIDPQCSLIIQHHKGHVRIIDEIQLKDTRTERVCNAFLDKAEQQSWNLRGLAIYGDASGSARDTTSGVSDWHIVRNCLRDVVDLRMRVPRSNPPIKDTVNAVNARIRNAKGEVNLAVSPKCKRLIQDMEDALADTDMEDQHTVAALRYFIDREYPVKIERGYMDNRIGAVA